MLSNIAISMIMEHADEVGQITWREASLIAATCDKWSNYAEEYACLLESGCGVDAGEFIVWLQQ